MGSCEQLEVKCGRHPSNLSDAFAAQQREQAFVDVTLVCSGNDNDESGIKAHRNVLSASSPFLRRIFIDNPHPHPVVVLHGLQHWAVSALVDFMYCGHISTTEDQVDSILTCAHSLQVGAFIDACHHTQRMQSRLIMPEQTSNPSGAWSQVIESTAYDSGTTEPEIISQYEDDISSKVETVRRVPKRRSGNRDRRRVQERLIQMDSNPSYQFDQQQESNEVEVLDLAIKVEPTPILSTDSSRPLSSDAELVLNDDNKSEDDHGNGIERHHVSPKNNRSSALMAYLTCSDPVNVGTVFDVESTSSEQQLRHSFSGSLPETGINSHGSTTILRRSVGVKVSAVTKQNQRYLCRLCNKTFGALRCLKAHAQLHNPYRKTHACTLCTRVYQRRGELLRHFKVFHPDVPIPYHQRYRPINISRGDGVGSEGPSANSQQADTDF